MQLVKRERYFAHSFMMLRFVYLELWKSCTYLGGQFLIDIRGPMERFASAQFGQNTSFFIASTVTRCAADATLRAMHSQTLPLTLVTWIRARLRLRSPEQFLILLFFIFQNELLKICLGNFAQKLASDIELGFMCGDLGVELSSKQESNLPFSTKVLIYRRRV